MSHKVKQLSPSIEIIESETLVAKDFFYNLNPFDERTFAFLQQLSFALIQEKKYNRNPEIASLSFWLRKANLLQIKKENQALLENKIFSVQPLGHVFHVCPSNVDTMFVYSSCISLLMGNKNIVKLSSQLTDTVEYIVGCINKLVSSSQENQLFGDYIKIITYDHKDEINKFFSENADGRIIWGGDNTVNYFKSIKTKIRSKDIVFPNRISYSIFQVDRFFLLSDEEKQKLAKNFFNDAYVFNQKGCSSPQVIYVLGNLEEKKKFLNYFYESLKVITTQFYIDDTKALSTLKLNVLVGDVLNENILSQKTEHNSIYFVEISHQSEVPENCGGGYFYIKHIAQLEELIDDVESRSQTLTYFGLNKEEIICLNNLLKGKGIDRIVPVGQALSFHYLWDGYNLIEELCRKRFLL